MTKTLIESRAGFRFHVAGAGEFDRAAALHVHESAFGAMEKTLRALPGWHRHLENGPGPEDDSDDHYAQLCDIDLALRDVAGKPCFSLWVRRDDAFDPPRLRQIRDAVRPVYERIAQQAGVTAVYRGAEVQKVWRLVETDVVPDV
jgi:hypothetical protein